MRKLLISLLLAGAAATPAIAGPNNWADQQSAQQDRQSAREDRQAARAERAQERGDSRAERSNNVAASNNVGRSQFSPGAAQMQMQQQMQMRQQQGFANGGYARPDRGNFGGNVEPNVRGNGEVQAAPGPRVVYVPGAQDREQRMQDRNQARDQRIQDRELRQQNRPVPNVVRDRHPLVVSNTPRPGTMPPLRAEGRRTPAVQWNTNWRNNSHYDWRDYRHHHRHLFHLGFYFDPFGWGYQPFDIGWRLWPAYYGSRYWINDPWMYRLPYAPPGYVWVRYWNDALLVDTWSGTVVDVIPDFFW